MNRRTFLASTAASLAAAPFILGQSKSGRKYRTALIGSGWWGMNILRVALEAGQAEVVALADVDADVLEISADEVLGLTGSLPKTYKDYRELLATEKPEIVIIATPDHWHALQAIAAVEAGAHVFVEKPAGHTILEGRAMVNAARRTGRIVQVGLHRRIGPHHVSGMEFLKSGKVGEIGMVRMVVTGGADGPEKPSENVPPPPELDWDLYCGPAPLRPFCKNIHPGRFRNYLDFANGTLGDWGVHWLDQMLWWSEEKWPKSVHCTGGRSILGPAILTEKEQTTDAPDHQIATYEFTDFTAVWEHRKFGGQGTDASPFGTTFYGTNGTFHMGWRDGWTFFPKKKGDAPVHQDPQFDHEKDGHNLPPLWRDFLSAIETGSKPVADIETAHLATNLALLGMISDRVGRSVAWDGEKEAILGDAEAQALLRRDYRAPWVYPA